MHRCCASVLVRIAPVGDAYAPAPTTAPRRVRDDVPVSARTRHRLLMAGVIGAYVAGLAGMAVVEARPGLDSPAWSLAVAAGWSVALGSVVAARCAQSPVSVGLVLLGAAPTLVAAIEEWAASWQSEAALPAADVVARCSQGVWVFNLAGFVVLAATFPSGPLPGRRWAVLPWAFVGVAVAAGVVLAAQPDQYVGGGGEVPGSPPFELPSAVNTVAMLAVAGGLISLLALSVAAVVFRYRAGDVVARAQLRWGLHRSAELPQACVREDEIDRVGIEGGGHPCRRVPIPLTWSVSSILPAHDHVARPSR
jgi:hypothetical protein